MSRPPRSAPSSEDRGFLLGDGLFETIRLYGGRPFRLEAHLARLERSAELVGIPFPTQLEARVAEAIGEWGGGEGALRITLTRGEGAGLVPAEGGEPTLVIRAREWSPEPRWYETGIGAACAGRVDERALTAGLKMTGYLERIQALRMAEKAGCEEALIRNTRGLVVEGSASNVFALVTGVVIAPGPPDGALPGITREVVLELLGKRGIQVEERGIAPEELAAAEEVILTSSLRELVPVVQIEGGKVGGGRPGPLFRELLEGYRGVVVEEH